MAFLNILLVERISWLQIQLKREHNKMCPPRRFVSRPRGRSGVRGGTKMNIILSIATSAGHDTSSHKNSTNPTLATRLTDRIANRYS